MAIRVFLSYSSKSKRLAHEVKKELEGFGFEVFVAHDNVHVGKKWRAEILRNLRKCSVFVPILNSAFIESEWCDQEAGFALALHKKIIPLKVTRSPYGFINVYQAARWHRNDPDKTYWEIVECLQEEPKFEADVKNGAIDAFLQKGDFGEVGAAASRLLDLRPFTRAQLRKLLEAAGKRHSIYGCRAARKPMDILIQDADGHVPDGLIRKYRDAVKGWPF